MQVLDSHTKFAHLGKPGTAFSKGFQRRLDIISKLVDLKDKKILDMGCGEGVWLDAFSQFTDWANIYGFDIDPESIETLKAQNPKLKTQNIVVSTAEELKFPDNTFDIVFSNEVFEHVEDDVKAAQEVLRVLKPGGKLILFTPNRGWPFETHGMFWKGKYIWGNIPFLPWMPAFIRKKLSPHVRNYSNGEIRSVFKRASLSFRENEVIEKSFEEVKNRKTKDKGQHNKGLRIEDWGLWEAGKLPADYLPADRHGFLLLTHKHVFPAFDKLERKFGLAGKLMQRFFHAIEKTPLHFFGISHLMVLEKVEKP